MRPAQASARFIDVLLASAGLALLGLVGPVLLLCGWGVLGRLPLDRVTLVGQNRRVGHGGEGLPAADRRAVVFPGRPIIGRRFVWPSGGFWSGLPLAWNLLRGEISLFGPRPLSLQEFHRLKFQFPRETHAPRVKPGILGLAQLDDSRDPARGVQRRKLRLDDEYLERRSPVLHLQILAFSLLDLFPGVSVDS